jgi:hypothetical protein
MVIYVLGSLDDYGRELIKEPTALKRGAPSCLNGNKFGRPRNVNDTAHIATTKRMKADGHAGKDIGKDLGVSWATVCRYFTQDCASTSIASIEMDFFTPYRHDRGSADPERFADGAGGLAGFLHPPGQRGLVGVEFRGPGRTCAPTCGHVAA